MSRLSALLSPHMAVTTHFKAHMDRSNIRSVAEAGPKNYWVLNKINKINIVQDFTDIFVCRTIGICRIYSGVQTSGRNVSALHFTSALESTHHAHSIKRINNNYNNNECVVNFPFIRFYHKNMPQRSLIKLSEILNIIKYCNWHLQTLRSCLAHFNLVHVWSRENWNRFVLCLCRQWNVRPTIESALRSNNCVFSREKQKENKTSGQTNKTKEKSMHWLWLVQQPHTFTHIHTDSQMQRSGIRCVNWSERTYFSVVSPVRLSSRLVCDMAIVARSMGIEYVLWASMPSIQSDEKKWTEKNRERKKKHSMRETNTFYRPSMPSSTTHTEGGDHITRHMC